MMTMGLLISHKNNEKRRALIPPHLSSIKHIRNLYFEQGYGEALGYGDGEYLTAGAQICSREEALKCDIICDVKLGDADFLEMLEPGRLLCGWAHAVQSISFTTAAFKGRHSVLAWEEMEEEGKYLYSRNREVAGEAAVLHGFRYCGKMPYDTRVAILGNGQTAKGAMRILHGLGAEIDVYPRKLEKLFKKRMYGYDVIVNCVFWDTSRTDHIIYKSDLAKFKPGTLIIDVSCNHGLEIESTRPTSIDNPVYTIDGVIHYAVDNTPAMFPITISKYISETFSLLVDSLITEKWPGFFHKALVIEKGRPLDEHILEYRRCRGII